MFQRERELNSSRKKGFTLIELLVVIAVIGLLSSIVLVSMTGAIEKARIAKTQEELKQIETAIILIRDKEDKTLKDITGSGCSDCACRQKPNLNTLLDSDPCIINWQNAFDKIGLSPLRDPWGSPYLIDENELEFTCDPCRGDLVRSAGPDRIIGQYDDPPEIEDYCLIPACGCGWTWTLNPENVDNIWRLVPMHTCSQ